MGSEAVSNQLTGIAILDRIAATRGAEHAWCLGIAAAVTFATWEPTTLRATGGLDSSWMTALHLAHVLHIGFGSHFVWTYGPLGYLAFPIAVTSSTLVQAFVFCIATQLTLCYLLCRAAMRTSPLLSPVVVLAVALLPLQRPDVLVMIVLLAAITILQDPGSQLWGLLATGSAAGAAVLMKTNSGITALAIVVVTAWARRDLGPRRWATIPVAVGTTVVLWLWTGNSLLQLLPWLRLSRGVVSGYSGAMQAEDVTLGWQYVLAGAVTLVLLAAVTLLIRDESWRLRAAAVLVVAGFLFAFFKEAFIRHDVYHGPYFFGAVAVAVTSFRWRGRLKWVALGVLVSCLAAVESAPGLPFQPAASAGRLGSQIATVADSARRRELVRGSKENERAVYQVPRRLLATLRGHTVHVEPFETAAIAAYGLAWRPLPIVQSYSAYTSALDNAEARALASDRAPQRILVEATDLTVNGRKRELSAPAAFHAMLCNYRQVAASDRWQVLARSAPRCDPSPSLIERVTARPGIVVQVPSAPRDALVLLRIHVDQGIWNRVRDLAYKPRVPIVRPGREIRVLLVPGTATDGIVVRFPASLTSVAGFDGERSWPSVTVTDAGTVTYEFFSQRVR